MALKKYDVVRTMIPFATLEDNKNRHKTLNFDRIMEAQMTGEFKYDRPCVIIGQDKKTGNVIMAEMRSDRTKPFRSLVNDVIDAGIPHESSILVHQDSLIHVEPDMIPIIDGDKCGHLSDKDIARHLDDYLKIYFKTYTNTNIMEISEYADNWITDEAVDFMPEIIFGDYYYPRTIENIKIIKDGKVYVFDKNQSEEDIKAAQQYVINWLKNLA